MKTFSPEAIRNFALVGAASSGKTLLSEAMLACAGSLTRMGSIENGTTVSDYHADEQQHRISMFSTPLHTEWQGKKFNILDTPGYLDFLCDSAAALQVVDCAVVVIHAHHGLGVGAEQMWNAATRHGIPKIIVINALDKENVSFAALLEQIRERFGKHIFSMQVPVNPGPGFNQVLDVLRSEVVTYPANRSGKYQEVPATGEWAGRVRDLHKELIEHVAESDDTLMEKFFEQGGLSEEVMRSGLHPAVQRQIFVPLFCTSATNNVGVARLMDFIAKFGSGPLDRPKVRGLDAGGSEVEVNLAGSDPVLYVFKTLSEGQAGEVSLFRVYSGSVHVGMDLYNSDRKVTERIGQLFLMHGKSRDAVNTVGPGDFGAVVKLKNTHTGNTLCAPHHVVALPKINHPKPAIQASLKLNSKGDEDKVAQGLATLHEEDPAFQVHHDTEQRQTIISAQGELHLDMICARLKRRFKVDVELVQPKIRFRETIRARGDSKYRHKKQTGGAGQFAEVWMRIEPAPRDSGVEFTQSLTGQNVDRVFVPSVEKGVQTACAEGILAGYRVTDLKVDFYDGKMHPVDSKDIAFQIAGYFAFKESFMKAQPCLLEPIHKLTIHIADEHLGKVMGDLSSRRGRILNMDSDAESQIIRAEVPAMELYRYSSTLRSLTGGRGTHEEEFSHYQEMPRELEQKIIAESGKHAAHHAH